MLRGLYAFALDELDNNILPFWSERVKDESTGGFFGAFHADGTPDADAPRVLILNARLLWTFSSAYRIFGDDSYLQDAWYAYRYFMKYFWDAGHIGAYYSVNPDGTPQKDYKLVYGQAFAIYALSEFYRATNHEPALKDAVALYEKLEEKALDKINDGYWECFSADWAERSDEQHSMALGTTKSMNTHLHLIEAYTSLLRVHDTPKMRADTARHFDIMTKKVLNRESGHYFMYLDDNWTRSNLVESYGHDIEGSWLMNECAHVIGDKELIAESEALAALIAGACLKAVMPDGSMLDEGTPEGGFHDESRVWWIQAENVVGMLNAWQCGGNARFLNTAYEQAMYIRRHMSDRIGGEWFGVLDENGLPDPRQAAKVTGWKCPYHNARMCFEIIERYEAGES
jgi:cellobiose epimerase